ncbi:MAG: leucine-rich repeat protein [Clostridia bacterium]|nr:leucine-rich repeat protein [Clostridia bacterium]
MKKNVKKLISIILTLAVFVCTTPVFALTSGDFTYEIVNGEAIITSYTGTATQVTVPAEIDGYTVYGVGDSAFRNNTEITTVTVTSGVKAIGAAAFENCESLATITLPSTIMHFGEKAIYNTAYYNDDSNWKKNVSDSSSGGTSIGGSGNDSEMDWEDIIASNLEYLYLGKILVEASFSGAYSIKYGTTVIADGAFAGSSAVSVTLANQTATIGENAFKDCTKLTSVKLSSNLEYIGKSAFENCTSLVDITLPEKDIQMYASAFYNTGYYNNTDNWNGDVLYYNTIAIGVNEDCSLAVIQDGTTKIIAEALLDKDVLIPASVTDISPEAFTSSENVTIYGYGGSYAQEHATAYNIKFVDLNAVVKGDLDFDGDIDKTDYHILTEIAILKRQETYPEFLAGDMDDDGAIDGIDVIILDLTVNGTPPSRIKGDADGDGDVDWLDYDLLVAISQTRARVTDNIMFLRCDLNKDGTVDSYDAIILDLALNNIIAL